MSETAGGELGVNERALPQPRAIARTGTSPFTTASAVDTTGANFSDFYHANFRDMVGLAASISGSAAVAEDVVQDAFARLFVRYDRVSDPRAYVRRSVVNGCTSRFRKHRRERLVDNVGDNASGDRFERTAQTTPAADLELGERLAGLAERQRAVVVLRIQYGFSEKETAQLMGCRPGTVGSLLHRALAVLRTNEEANRG